MQPDRDLDRELRDLGPRVQYPPVPDLARSVRGRLDAEAGGPGSPARSGPQLWWIAAAAVLVLLLAVPVFSLAIRGTGGMSSGVSAGGGAAEPAGREAAGGDRAGAGDVTKQEAPASMDAEAGASFSTASGSAEAACASPSPVLEVRPARGAPGDEFRVLGKHFVAGYSVCDDAPPEMSAQTVPARGVRVEFRQNGRTWELGSVEADEESRLTTTLKVPADARPGRATVRATYDRGPGAPSYTASAEARFLVLNEGAAPPGG